ncbi:MAG TPA: phosphotransferase [Anaerolineales bacterium]|nr:phosphotransferase [Anaerolineales bacterium]
MVFIILPEDQREPALVAKVSRLAGVSESLEREYANLRKIQASRSQGFNSIPYAVTLDEIYDYPILIETALVGQQMDPPTVRKDASGCIRSIFNWLLELHKATSVNSNSDPDWFERLVEGPIRFFQETVPLDSEELNLIRETQDLVGPLRNSTLSLGFEHGDLSHPNVIRLKRGGPGILDWEQAEPRGFSISDLFFFLAYVAFAKHGARERANYLPAVQTAFFGKDAWARSYVREYASRTQIPIPTLSPLFALCWFKYLVTQLKRLSGAGNQNRGVGDEAINWLRGNRYYRIWRYTIENIDALKWDT